MDLNYWWEKSVNTGTYKSLLYQLNDAPHKLALSACIYFNDHTGVLHSKIYCFLNFDFTPNPESPK